MSSPPPSKPSLPVLLYGTQTGPKHLRKGLPCQDAFVGEVHKDYVLFVFSDGHGSSKYAEDGATLAVHLMHASLVEVATWLNTGNRDEDMLHEIQAKVVNTLKGWRNRVDVLAEARQEVCSYKDYGCTLGFSLATEGAVLVGQLGDGDILKVNQAGELHPILPSDAELFGDETTSLCSPNPETHLRLKLTPTARPGYLLFLATDGYSKAYEIDDFQSVPKGYQNLLRENSLEEVQGALPDFLHHVSIGSGDDTTLGLFYWPSGTELYQMVQSPFVVSSEIPISWKDRCLWEVAPHDCFRQHAPSDHGSADNALFGDLDNSNLLGGFGAECVVSNQFDSEGVIEHLQECIGGMGDAIADDEASTTSAQVETASELPIVQTHLSRGSNGQSRALGAERRRNTKQAKQYQRRQSQKAQVTAPSIETESNIITRGYSNFDLHGYDHYQTTERYVPGLKKVELAIFKHVITHQFVGFVTRGKYKNCWVDLPLKLSS